MGGCVGAALSLEACARCVFGEPRRPAITKSSTPMQESIAIRIQNSYVGALLILICYE